MGFGWSLWEGMKKDSSWDTFTPDNSILAFFPRNPRHRILLCTPEPDLLQELYQVLGGLLWWPAPYSLHGLGRWALGIGSAESPAHGPGLTLRPRPSEPGLAPWIGPGVGPRGSHLLPESWCSSKYEFRGGGSPRPPPNWERHCKPPLITLGVGSSPHR